jgi:hypothetical protein
MSIREHVLRVMLPIFAIFLIALGVGWATVRLTERYNSSLVTTGGTAMATGLVLAVALWFYGLSSSDRSRIMRRLAAFSVRRDHEL